MSAELIEQGLERDSIYGNLSENRFPGRMTDVLPPEYFDQMHPDVDIDLEFVERKTKNLFDTPTGMTLESDSMTEILQGLSTESKSTLVQYLQGSLLEVDPETILELDTCINKKAAGYTAAQMGGYALEVILLPATDPNWRVRAACRQYGYDTHFPDYEGNGGIRTKKAQAGIAAAKAICKLCEVKPECLEHALSYDEKYGVWAGLDPEELEELRG